jgi:aminoglycoside/choline kinase family phosphotransferase
MLSDVLIDQTVTRFPRLDRSEIVVAPLEKGGSDRKYYRVRTGAAQSLILVKYGDQREENRHYVEIAQFLAGIGVRVPRIFHHDPDEGLIWMEDLGERDLWSARNDSWPARSALYRSALQEAARLHGEGLDRTATCEVTLQPAFDAALYRWEQNYFFENCLGRYFQIPPERVEALSRLGALGEMAEELSGRQRVLVHRDFQSQNIMIVGEDAYLIDFQGLREGLPQYDLASLLYDPYVVLRDAERAELLAYYITETIDRGVPMDADFERVLDLCAAQRLMQALGAYGFLGCVKGRAAFLAHIPAALRSLRIVVGRIPGLEPLEAVLRELQ